MRHHRLLRLLAALLLVAVAAAAEAEAAAPRCQENPYRDFDFWLGEWRVETPDGQHAGDNSITAAQGGCLLVERWRGSGGGTGESYSYVDPATRRWRQVWVSPGANIDCSGALDEAGDMVLEGSISYRNGTTAPFRGRWSILEDGAVRQHFEQQDAATAEWQDWFVGIYRHAP